MIRTSVTVVTRAGPHPMTLGQFKSSVMRGKREKLSSRGSALSMNGRQERLQVTDKDGRHFVSQPYCYCCPIGLSARTSAMRRH